MSHDQRTELSASAQWPFGAEMIGKMCNEQGCHDAKQHNQPSNMSS